MTLDKFRENIDRLFTKHMDKEITVVTKRNGNFVELDGIDLTLSTEYVLDDTGAYVRKDCLIIE